MLSLEDLQLSFDIQSVIAIALFVVLRHVREIIMCFVNIVNHTLLHFNLVHGSSGSGTVCLQKADIIYFIPANCEEDFLRHLKVWVNRMHLHILVSPSWLSAKMKLFFPSPSGTARRIQLENYEGYKFKLKLKPQK